MYSALSTIIQYFSTEGGRRPHRQWNTVTHPPSLYDLHPPGFQRKRKYVESVEHLGSVPGPRRDRRLHRLLGGGRHRPLLLSSPEGEPPASRSAGLRRTSSSWQSWACCWSCTII